MENKVPGKNRIAVHQAGHAVVQALVARGRFKVTHVSLACEHSNTWRGLPTVGEATIDRETFLGLYEYGLVTLAGIAAEERYHAMSEPEDEPLVAISDLADWNQQAWQVLQSEAHIRLVGLNVMQKLRQWFSEKKVWQVVETLARELYEKDSVQGERLKLLLAPLGHK